MTQGPKYSVQGEIARGGMGQILRAVDGSIGRDVAMKVILQGADPVARARFLEEAKLTGKLEHPNIVPVHEIGTDAQGRPFFTMKLVQGKSLAEIVKELKKGQQKGEYTLPKLLNIFVSVCNAVAFAHSKGVLHRDLKPANVMVGDFGEVLVMDWGLAKLAGAAEAPAPAAGTPASGANTTAGLTQEGSILGTPLYMPPEQARGERDKIDHRSDIYSLGAILYEILTLQPPIDARSAIEVIHKVRENEITMPIQRAPECHVPAELSAVAMKALSKDPERRYQAVADLKRDIELFLEDRSVSAKEDSAWELLVKLIRRNRGASVALGGATIIIMILIATGYWMNLEERRSAEEQRTLAQVERHKSDAALIAFKLEQMRRVEEERKRGEERRKAAPAFAATAARMADRMDFDGALLNVNIAVDGDPSLASAWMLKAQLQIVKADHAEALSAIGEYLKLKSDDKDARRLAELCRKEEDENGPRLASEFAAIFLRQNAPALAENQLQSVNQLFEAYKVRLDRTWNEGGRLQKLKDGTFSFQAHGNPTIRDITPLRGMLLSGLNLHGSNISDLRPLEGMPLESLVLSSTTIADLAPLRGMKLKNLDIRHTEVDDLGPLRGMPLTELLASNCNAIADLSPLAGMPLAQLQIGYTQVRDLSPLKGAPLTSLDLNQTRIRDLSPLADMPLANLVLSVTEATDLAPLKGMPLKRLVLNHSKVTELSPLEGMRLETLDLSGLRIKSLSPLAGMPLKWLSFSRSNIPDLSALKGLPLTWLDLNDANVADLSPLQGMPLTHLSFTKTQVTDLSPLIGMPLEVLSFQFSTVSDLTPLKNLQLKSLKFEPRRIVRGMDVIRGMQSLLNIDGGKAPMRPEEFWKRYDAGEFK